MTCPECGEAITGPFCGNCGAATDLEPPVDVSEPADMPVPEYVMASSLDNPTVSPNARRSLFGKLRGLTMVQGVGLLVIVVIAIAVGATAVTQGGRSKAASSSSSNNLATQTYADYVSTKGQKSCYEVVWSQVDDDLRAGASLGATFNGPNQTAGSDMDAYMTSFQYDDSLPDAAAKFRQAVGLAQQDVANQFAGQSAQHITQSWNLDNIAEAACKQVGYKGPMDPAS